MAPPPPGMRYVPVPETAAERSIFATLHLTSSPRVTFTAVMAAMVVFAALGALAATRIGRIDSVR